LLPEIEKLSHFQRKSNCLPRLNKGEYTGDGAILFEGACTCANIAELLLLPCFQ
jgi:hypothetical protein